MLSLREIQGTFKKISMQNWLLNPIPLSDLRKSHHRTTYDRCKLHFLS